MLRTLAFLILAFAQQEMGVTKLAEKSRVFWLAHPKQGTPPLAK